MSSIVTMVAIAMMKSVHHHHHPLLLLLFLLKWIVLSDRAILIDWEHIHVTNERTTCEGWPAMLGFLKRYELACV